MEKTFHKEYKNMIIEFVGTEQNKNIDYEEIDELFDSCFSDFENEKFLKTIIANVRTILRSFKEKKLKVQISDNDIKTIIRFKDEKLVFFSLEEKMKNEKNEDVLFNAKFIEPLEFNFSFSSIEKNKTIQMDNLEMQKNISRIMRKIYFFENICPIQLDYCVKKLCNFYKLFYGENPNFSDKDINIKFQTMMYILNIYDIEEDYIFTTNTYNNQSVALSNELTIQVEKLKPLGKIKEFDNLNENNYTKRIQIIGNFVKEYTQNDINNMIKLINILYAKKQYEKQKWIQIDKNTLFTLSKNLKYSIEDIEESIELVRKINKKLEEKQE